MKPETSNLSGIKKEASDTGVDWRPVHVPTSRGTVLASPSTSDTSAIAALGVKRKASDDLTGSLSPRVQRAHTGTASRSSSVANPPDVIELDDSSTPASENEGVNVLHINKQIVIEEVEGVFFPRASHSRERPEPELYMQLVNGPKVDLIVGPNKHLFQLPIQLLSHYSTVFDRSFKLKKEEETPRMELANDTVEDFHVLIEYILHHSIANVLSIAKCGKNTAERCISFFKFADKYDLGDVSQAVYDVLRPAFVKYGQACFDAKYIEVVFKLTRDGNCLRELIVDAAIVFGGNVIQRQGYYSMNCFGVPHAYQELEDDVEGFTLLMLRRLVKMLIPIIHLEDPFSGKRLPYYLRDE